MDNLAHILRYYDTEQMTQLARTNPDFPNSPDSNGLYPLHYAALYGNNEVLKFLISQYGSDFNCTTPQKTTPLHLAARNGSTECVKTLLDFNASLDEADQMGWTPLHYACYRGYTEIAMQLIRKGSNLNLRTAEGYTPLHISCFRGDIKLMEDLINKDADINAKDKHGETPLELIQLFKREEPASVPPPPVVNISISKTKKRVAMSNDDYDYDYDNNFRYDKGSVTPPSISEFSPVNERFILPNNVQQQTASSGPKSKLTLQDSSKKKKKIKKKMNGSNSDDDGDDDGDDDNDDNYEDHDGSHKKKSKKKDEHEKHNTTASAANATTTTTTPRATAKAPLQLTFKMGTSTKQSDQKGSKTIGSSGSLHSTSSSKNSLSLHIKAEPKDSAELTAPSSTPPAKKMRTSNNSISTSSLPKEAAPEDVHKKQPKSSKKSSKRSSISSSAEPISPPPQQSSGSGGTRSIASSVVNSHSSRIFSVSSSSSLISLDDDPLFSVCDCFKLIMSSACPQEVKKAIKATNISLKDKIYYLLDAHNREVCQSIIEKLRRLDVNMIFENPVTVKIAPDYFRYVRSPMDFRTLEDYVRRRKIISVKEFIIWGRQIWQSCFTYNTKKDPLFISGRDYSLEFENYVRAADWRPVPDQDEVMNETFSSWAEILSEFDDATREKIFRCSGIPDLDPYKYFDEIRIGFFSVPTRELTYIELEQNTSF